ncbi:ATP-binding protein [Alcaligenes faecalis]|uniref:ATP-binding protein n=1 Tax=Alcaligenes faecalis TaxID=511 RepID=UPI00293275EE|nr:ATP-binding protein [Alcaligenes faecalis]MDV2117104.1 ATP-binding protein [Alcaligenes faecalis]
MKNLLQKLTHIRSRLSSSASRPQGWSLRRRLLLTVMGTSIGLWLVSLSIVVSVAWHATGEVLDDALEEGARLVLMLDPQEAAPGTNTTGTRLNRDEALKLRMYYQLVAADGRILLRGDDTPKMAFLPQANRKQITTVWVDEELWRVYVRPGAGGVTAQVAQPMEERLELLEDMAENLVWPAVGLLALLGLSSWFLIRRLMHPLEDTAKRIKAKSPDDLTPVQGDNPPRELQAMLDALNTLMARLSTALDSERRFTSDAAHELRTPLAGLRMRVQLIERELQLPDAHLQQLRADLDRCTALVESLLALTRLEPQAEPLKRETVDLNQILDSLSPSLPSLSVNIERALTVTNVQAAPVLLSSALRNLIGNAIRYGGTDVRVRVETTRRHDGGVRLAVRDNGPGVPVEQRPRLGERFFRVLGTGQAGNGLGLSIVARIAALHHATLSFEDGLDGQGLSVVLDFPPSQAS